VLEKWSEIQIGLVFIARSSSDDVTIAWQTKKSWRKDWITRISGVHSYGFIDNPIIDNESNLERHYKRRNCVDCRKIVNTRCQTCKVHLCIITDGETATCFDVFHDRKVLNVN
jgi:hypothetical protein